MIVFDSTRVVYVILIYLTTVFAQDDPTNVACTVLGSSSIQLSWTRPTNTAVNGYHVSAERVDGIINGTSIPSIELSSYSYVSYTYHGLGNYAEYNLSVHSYIGATNYTDVSVTCTTNEDAPNGAPYNFNCTAISVSEITCTWNALERAYWNGVLLGYRLQWLGENVSEIFSANVSANVYTYTATGLYIDTRYIFLLSGFNSVNFGTVYSTEVETTLGAIVKVEENVTRYYCYEAVPGLIEISWDEMPCTVYSGTIAGMLLLILLLATILCCCGRTSGPAGVEINMINGPSRGHSRSTHKSDYDGGSTTETDAEDDMPDDQEESVKHVSPPVSPISTPAESRMDDLKDDPENTGSVTKQNNRLLDVDDTVPSDSDYSSDIDDDTNKGGKTMVQGMKLKTLSKSGLNVNTSTSLANIHKAEVPYTSVIDSPAHDECDNDDMFEDWNPDTSQSAGNTNIIGESTNKSKDPLINSNRHGKRISASDTKQDHKAKQLSEINEDALIERTASVSSILVDTTDDNFGSMWSPEPNQVTQPVHNAIFRMKSTAGTKSKTDMRDANVKAIGVHDGHNQTEVSDMNPTVTNDKITTETPDIVDHINLIDTPIQKGTKGDINSRGKMENKSNGTLISTTPAWLSNRQRDEIRKASNITPVQQLSIGQTTTVVDIEPVLGSDRIGKKFPFLSLENAQQEQKRSQQSTKPFATNAWSRPRNANNSSTKSQQKGSNKDTIIIMTENLNKGDSPDNTESVAHSNESKGQIFYGFGLGRFRKAARIWLNKFRLKRNNVKLANSKWD